MPLPAAIPAMRASVIRLCSARRAGPGPTRHRGGGAAPRIRRPPPARAPGAPQGATPWSETVLGDRLYESEGGSLLHDGDSFQCCDSFRPCAVISTFIDV